MPIFDGNILKMYNFEKLLKQHKFPAEGPSTATKRKISQLRALETKIASAKNSLPTVKSERKKMELQNDIQEAEDALLVMDAEICDGINKFVKNKDVYAANAERLKASRGAKTAAPDPEPPAEPAPDPKPDPKPEPIAKKGDEPAPAEPKPNPTPAPDPKPKDPEKKISGSAVGWVAAAIGLVVAVIVGKNVIENR